MLKRTKLIIAAKVKLTTPSLSHFCHWA